MVHHSERWDEVLWVLLSPTQDMNHLSECCLHAVHATGPFVI